MSAPKPDAWAHVHPGQPHSAVGKLGCPGCADKRREAREEAETGIKRCEACNVVIPRGHCSDPRCNTYGIGVVLCDDCAAPVSLLDDVTFKAGRWKYSERTVLVLADGAVDTVRTPRALKAYVEARDTEADLLLRLRTGALDQVADLAGMFLAASQATDRAARALADEAVEAFGKAGAK